MGRCGDGRQSHRIIIVNIFQKSLQRSPGLSVFVYGNRPFEFDRREGDTGPCQTGVQQVLNGNPGRWLASSVAAEESVSVTIDRS